MLSREDVTMVNKHYPEEFKRDIVALAERVAMSAAGSLHEGFA
jgi:transposase-like protein